MLGRCMVCNRLVTLSVRRGLVGSERVYFPVKHARPFTHVGCGGDIHRIDRNIYLGDSFSLSAHLECEKCGRIVQSVEDECEAAGECYGDQRAIK